MWSFMMEMEYDDYWNEPVRDARIRIAAHKNLERERWFVRFIEKIIKFFKRA